MNNEQSKDKFQKDLMNLQRRVTQAIDLTQYKFLTEENFQKYVLVLDKTDNDLKAKYGIDNVNVRALCDDMQQVSLFLSEILNQFTPYQPNMCVVRGYGTYKIHCVIQKDSGKLIWGLESVDQIIYQNNGRQERLKQYNSIQLAPSIDENEDGVVKDEFQLENQLLKDKIRYLEGVGSQNRKTIGDQDCKIQLISKQLNVLVDINQLSMGVISANQTVFKNFRQKMERYEVMLNTQYTNQIRTKRFTGIKESIDTDRDNLQNCELKSFAQYQKIYDTFQQNNMKNQILQLKVQKEDTQIFEFQNRLLKDHLDNQDSVINQCKGLDLQKTIKYLFVHLKDLKVSEKQLVETQETLQFSLEEYLQDADTKKQYQIMQQQKKVQLENQHKKLQKDIDKNDKKISQIKVQMVDSETQFEEQVDIFQQMDLAAKKEKKKLHMEGLHSKIESLEKDLRETKDSYKNEQIALSKLQAQYDIETHALKTIIHNDEFEKKNLRYKFEDASKKISQMSKLQSEDTQKQIIEKLSLQNLAQKDTIQNLQFRIKSIQDKLKKRVQLKNDDELMEHFDITDTYDDQQLDFAKVEASSSMGQNQEWHRKFERLQDEFDQLSTQYAISNTKIRNLQNKAEIYEKQLKLKQSKVSGSTQSKQEQSKQVGFNIPQNPESHLQPFEAEIIKLDQIEQLQTQNIHLEQLNNELLQKILQLESQLQKQQNIQANQQNLQENKQNAQQKQTVVAAKTQRISKIQTVQTQNQKLQRNLSTNINMQQAKNQQLEAISENGFQTTQQQFFKADQNSQQQIDDISEYQDTNNLKSDTKSIDMDSCTFKNGSQLRDNISTKNQSLKNDSVKMSSVKSVSSFFQNNEQVLIQNQNLQQLQKQTKLQTRASTQIFDQSQNSFIQQDPYKMQRKSMINPSFQNKPSKPAEFNILRVEEIFHDQNLQHQLEQDGVDIISQGKILNSIMQYLQEKQENQNQLQENKKSSIPLITKSKIVGNKQPSAINKAFQKLKNKEEALKEVLDQDVVNKLINTKEINSQQGFMNVIKLIDQQHSNCQNASDEDICLHLLRFNERLGFQSSKNQKKIMSLTTNAIKQLPILKRNIMNVL